MPSSDPLVNEVATNISNAFKEACDHALERVQAEAGVTPEQAEAFKQSLAGLFDRGEMRDAMADIIEKHTPPA